MMALAPLNIDAILDPEHLWNHYYMLDGLSDEALVHWAFAHCVDYPRNVVLRGVEWRRVYDDRGLLTGRVAPVLGEEQTR